MGLAPLVYFAVLLGSIVVFSRTRNFPWLLRVGQLDILLAPTLSMIPLGGFLASGGVGLWGMVAPLGALVFSEVRSAVRWYVAWVVVFLGSGIAGEAGPGLSPVPTWFTSTMLALNIVVGGAIMFTLLAVLARERRDALAALRVEQAKSKASCSNILPRTVADRLKAQTRPIGSSSSPPQSCSPTSSTSRPGRSGVTPADVVGCLDRLFSHFDALAERYDLEKIKTMGDCYMVAAGVLRLARTTLARSR